jgi:hypothetical protein
VSPLLELVLVSGLVVAGGASARRLGLEELPLVSVSELLPVLDGAELVVVSLSLEPDRMCLQPLIPAKPMAMAATTIQGRTFMSSPL